MNCPRCGAPAIHVAQYQAWFCQACQAYASPPAAKSGVNLWLVIGLPIALVGILIGVLVFTSVRSFKRYVDKSKVSETHANLHALQYGAKSYFIAENALPGPNVGPTPARSCCDHGGKCQPDPSEWQHEVWTALEFEPYGAHYYQYQYEASTTGFTVRALGDLDCDGELSTFEMYGEIRDGELELADAIFKNNELE